VDNNSRDSKESKPIILVCFSNRGLFAMRESADLFIDGTYKVRLNFL
jgi:hypothetical protein